MAHLLVTRTGWQNEHLGLFLLSKFAFVANPVTVSDDLGSDFFCTLFDTRNHHGRKVVVPLNSFAIQIKSSTRIFDVSNKVAYLRDLEIPFFVGVVNQKKLTLTIYSGEYLPLLFSLLETPKRLRIRLVNHSVAWNQYHEKYGKGKYRILFPRITTAAARGNQQLIRQVTQQIYNISARTQRNIASRRTNEHVYEVPPPKERVIMAGSGSVQTFRKNFYLRLEEVFYNLDWLLQNQRRNFNLGEFLVYERFFLDLKRYLQLLPPHLIERYKRLRKRLKAKGLLN